MIIYSLWECFPAIVNTAQSFFEHWFSDAWQTSKQEVLNRSFHGHRSYHCLHTQVVITARRKFALISSAFLGHNNDAGCLLQMASIGVNGELPLPHNCYLLADKAYMNGHPFMVQYMRHELAGIPVVERHRRNIINRIISKKRVYAEHLIKELKIYRIIGILYRHPRWEVANIVEFCAGLSQRRLEFFETVW